MEYGSRREGSFGAGNDTQYEKGYVKTAKRCFSRMALAYVIYIVVSTASQLAAAAILLRFTGIDQNLRLMICMLAMYPAAILIFYLVIRKVPRARQTRRETLSVGEYLCTFVVSMGCMYLGNFIGQALMMAVSLVTGEPMVNAVQELILGMEPWTILIVAVIAAPIAEEFLFRKCLLDRIAGYGQITSMMVSGVLFGLAHGNFYQFFYAFALGVIFAYVYLKTGNVWHTVGLHMMINFCGSIIPMYLLKIMEKNMVLGSFLAMAQMMLMFGFVVAAVIILISCREKIRIYKRTTDVPMGKWGRTVFLNAGMLLFFLCSVVIFVAG